MTVDSTVIGRRVRAARLSRRWSQNQLAERAGVDSGYVSRLEAGRYKRPSADKLTSIAQALGRRLVDLTDPPPAALATPGGLRAEIDATLGPGETPEVEMAIKDLLRADPQVRANTLRILRVLIPASAE